MNKLSFLFTLFLIALFAYRCSEDNSVISDDKAGPDITGEYISDASGRGGPSGTGGDGGDTIQQEPVEPGQITAAEWNDLLEWDFWINLGQNQEFVKAEENWNFYLSERYSFIIKNSEQQPVIDCEVVLKNLQGNVLWKAKTDNEGKAELWLNINGGEEVDPVAVIKYAEGELTIVDPMEFDEGINEVTLTATSNNIQKADILFVVDATGSMGDEIEYLKSELLDVIRKSEEVSQVDLRTGAVFYRDEGDDYLTKVSPFSSMASQTLAFINDQEAKGGGDYEEAVHTALNTAITQMSWSSSARTRLLFLLLDAPPHHTQAITGAVNDIIKEAAAMGIRIIPISASGINKDTEFLFRFFATATNGTYVFITNDSGIGGEHIEATVGDYEVELLNELIVRLITKYTL
ncbi:MAG TPA: VWA domain-containing protein [Bacteroidales bacterium]|jgi:hypothetical protein|nr:VWA domain-containing protein [Bacteroidales bacterium]